MEYRSITVDDFDRIIELDAQCFKTKWSEASYLNAIKDEAVIGLGAVENNVVVGFVFALIAPFDLDILKVAVSPNFRRRGIATALLGELFSLGRELNKELVFLDVRVSNTAAQSLYKSVGFLVVGKRLKYYENVEDSLTMSKLL